MKNGLKIIASLLLTLAFCAPAMAGDAAPESAVLITNANIFDGQNEKLAQGMSVLIEGNMITKIAKSIQAPDGATVIDGGGRTLMPGLIDDHMHLTYSNIPFSKLMTEDLAYISIVGLQSAEATLMRGFTTIRDVGGNTFSIKKLIDAGEYAGPRIYPSGPPISQTSGHYDGRGTNDTPQNPSDPLPYVEKNYIFMVADGVPEVMKRTREILRKGASQIKIAAGGGVSSPFDPVDVAEYTYEEIKAIVDVAETWNTYVCAHVFTDEAVQTSLRAGVKSIEHGFLIEKKETMQMIKDNDAWLSIEPLLNDEDADKFDNPFSTQKYIEVTKGTDRVYKMGKEMGVNMAFGTDILFNAEAAEKEGKFLAKLSRWFTPYEALKMATSENAKLLGLCGPRNPYQAGPLGVIKEGAYADLILVEGNPLEDLGLVADPHKNFVLIMKDGKIYKNTIK